MRISDWSSDVCSSDLRLDRSIPFLEMGIVFQPLALPLVAAQPGERGDIGDAVFRTAEPGALRQPLVDHPVKAHRLVGVEVYRVRNLLRRVIRLEDGRVGKEGGSTGSSWWWRDHSKKK